MLRMHAVLPVQTRCSGRTASTDFVLRMRMNRICAHFLRHRVNQHRSGVWCRVVRWLSAVVKGAHISRINFSVISPTIRIIALGWRHLGIFQQFHSTQTRILIDITGAPASVYPQCLFPIYIHHHVASINHARRWNKQIVMNELANMFVQERPCIRLFMAIKRTCNVSGWDIVSGMVH